MDRWSEKIEGSQALAEARALTTLLEQSGASSPDEQDFVDRLERVAEHVEWTLLNADPRLVADPVLQTLATNLAAAQTHINSWRAGSGPEYLTAHAMNEADLALGVLASIPIADTAAEASTEIASLRRSVGQHRGQVEREMEALTATRVELEAQMTAAMQAANSRVEAAEAEVERLRAEVAAGTTAARELANTHQTAFDTLQTERQEVFSRLLEEKRQEITDAVAALNRDAQQQAVDFDNSTKANVAAANAAKERVEEILEIVSEEALVGTYSKNATEEKNAANFWRWVAVLAIAASVAIGFSLIASADESGTDWDAFAAKVALGIPIGGVAAYAAKQSGEHRGAQRDAQHIALQLAAVKPYLDDLETPGERDRLLAVIAERIFGQPRHVAGGSAKALDEIGDNPALLSQLVAALLKVTADKK